MTCASLTSMRTLAAIVLVILTTLTLGCPPSMRNAPRSIAAP